MNASSSLVCFSRLCGFARPKKRITANRLSAIPSGQNIHPHCNIKIHGSIPRGILIFRTISQAHPRRPTQVKTFLIEIPAGEQITAAVLDVKGNQVRIGTDAPRVDVLPSSEV